MSYGETTFLIMKQLCNLLVFNPKTARVSEESSQPEDPLNHLPPEL